jgi:hypothetical protein
VKLLKVVMIVVEVEVEVVVLVAAEVTKYGSVR